MFGAKVYLSFITPDPSGFHIPKQGNHPLLHTLVQTQTQLPLLHPQPPPTPLAPVQSPIGATPPPTPSPTRPSHFRTQPTRLRSPSPRFPLDTSTPRLDLSSLGLAIGCPGRSALLPLAGFALGSCRAGLHPEAEGRGRRLTEIPTSECRLGSIEDGLDPKRRRSGAERHLGVVVGCRPSDQRGNSENGGTASSPGGSGP